MKNENLNKSLYEKLFGGELEVTEMPMGGESEAKLYQASLRRISVDECKMIQRITQILEEMEEFFHTKKNMFLSIREGIAVAKKEIQKLSASNKKHGSFLIYLEYFLCLQVARESSDVEVSLTKKPFRGTRKTLVKMEEARALKLLKAAHIKIGWVSCRVRRKTEVKRCYRCLGFGHMAADCRGPDRNRCC